MESTRIRTYDRTLSASLAHGQTTVLKYKISYPQFQSSDPSLDLEPINIYYQEKAQLLEHYSKTIIRDQAVMQLEESLTENFPFHEYQVYQSYTITLLTDQYISLYYDIYLFTGGAHGTTTRLSNTWNVSNGQIYFLKDFFPSDPGYENTVKTAVSQYIGFQNAGPGGRDSRDYFPDWERNVNNTFNPNNFYLTPQGVAVFFQQYDIAPYSSGIPVFLLKYRDCFFHSA